MFGSKEKETQQRTEAPARPAPDRREKTVLGEGSQFNGILKIQGNVAINGEFDGTITCTGSLLIGKSGKVKGEVESHEVVVAGHLEGRIFAEERVELQTGSHFTGDVHAKSFMIQEGVFFQGNCAMGDPRRPSAAANKLAEGQKPELGILKQS